MRAALALILCLVLVAPSAADPDYEAAFSPRGQSLDLVLSTIRSARQSIRMAAYSFTSEPIAAALTDAARRGVDVKVVADKQANSSRYSVAANLAEQGIPVRLNGNYAIFQHKFILVDGRHLETGSFNYNASVENNADNVLVLHDAPVMVEKYQAEWERLWQEGVDVRANY